MEYRLLGNAGLKVPSLCFGCATFGGGNEFFQAWGAADVAEATRIVDLCLDAGVNFFDTADIYSDGLSETILGKAIEGRRHDVLISSKATFRLGKGPNDVGSSRHHLLAACASESINSKIQWVKYTARGFRSTKNFVTAIYFHCGGLDLMPTH